MAVPYSAYPQAEADWLYDNQSLPKDNIYTSAERTEYRLKDPKKSDQGRYKIVIKNKHGQGEAFINLDVIGELSVEKNMLTKVNWRWLHVRVAVPIHNFPKIWLAQVV